MWIQHIRIYCSTFNHIYPIGNTNSVMKNFLGRGDVRGNLQVMLQDMMLDTSPQSPVLEEIRIVHPATQGHMKGSPTVPPISDPGSLSYQGIFEDMSIPIKTCERIKTES